MSLVESGMEPFNQTGETTMPRTAEPVDTTAGTKTKDAEIGSVKGTALAAPIKFSYSWNVPSVDEIVTALGNAETAEQIISELATARRDSAMTVARAAALAENEPIELKIAKFVKFAEKMNPGKSLEFYEAQAKSFLA